ncbi:MAG: RES family NAD+ phosphorylase [Litoreibacter sp.]
MKTLTSVELPVWRILPSYLVEIPSAPARAPEGRFHHSGQIAAYASLSVEGASVAIQRYLFDKIERKLIPMRFEGDCVADERGNTEASVVWQDIRASGELPPTWAISDAAREIGAKAMLYSSRSRPDLSHVVIFDPSCLTFVGPASSFG